MKPYPEPPPEYPQDTLGVYLALERRVRTLEHELEFTKLTINALYMEIKALKHAEKKPD